MSVYHDVYFLYSMVPICSYDIPCYSHEIAWWVSHAHVENQGAMIWCAAWSALDDLHLTATFHPGYVCQSIFYIYIYIHMHIHIVYIWFDMLVSSSYYTYIHIIYVNTYPSLSYLRMYFGYDLGLSSKVFGHKCKLNHVWDCNIKPDHYQMCSLEVDFIKTIVS